MNVGVHFSHKTVAAGNNNKRGISLTQEAVEIIFRSCPFCHSTPSVFQVPEFRYGKENQWSWTLECLNMGCLFKRPETGDQSLNNLANRWNGTLV